MRILFIRHADPDYSIDSLTPKGWKEAELLNLRMKKDAPDYVYCSPLGRAQDTCLTALKGTKKTFETKDWLREFSYSVTLPYAPTEKHCIWDWLPSYWSGVDELADNKKWLELPLIKEGDIPKLYESVCMGLDETLEKHGYKRVGKIYQAVKSNRDTVAFFCHFGITAVLMSHILNIPPSLLLHGFVALPSSVTELYTEEREKGVVSFRCAAFGDTSHLYAGGEKPSFAARFCETFDSDERH